MVKKITNLIAISFIMLLVLFTGCSSQNSLTETTPQIDVDTTADNTNTQITQEPQDVLDETLDSELIAEDEEVEIGELI